MQPSNSCRRCGARLAAGAEGTRFCAACVLREALEPEADGASGTTRLPRRLGAYELQAELGRGGMGVVYRAWQPALRRHVALKLLLAGAYSSEAELRRFHHEAEAAAGLQHPGIIAIHEFGESEGQPYYAMEYIPGRNLAQICAQQRLRPEHAARFTRDLASAVAYAHGRGVLHRDLKPSNVLVGPDGRPRIGDFGLARRIDAGSGTTLVGQMLGSPSYASPEQMTGQPDQLGTAADVYGLGALLYHLLTGRAPFEATSPTETMRLVLNTEPAAPRLLNAHVPDDLQTICLCCLEKDPRRRYPSATAVAEDLDRFLRREPIHAQPPSPWYRGWLFCRRHQLGVGALAGVFLVLVVALVVVGRALTNERAAFARTLAAERAEREARSHAGKFASSMTSDFGYTLQRYTNVGLLQQVAEQTVAYYEQIPAPERDLDVIRRHAAALEQLATLRISTRPHPLSGIPELEAAIRLREQIVRADANDAESAALVLWDRWCHASIERDAKTNDPAWRDAYIQRWRELYVRFPHSLPVKGCLAWALGRQSILLGQRNLRPDDVLPLALEGRRLVEEMERLPQLPPEDENHLIALSQGSDAALALAYLVAGQTEKAVHVREQCLARCAEALRRDPGNRLLRALTAVSALALAETRAGVSTARRHEAFTLAQTHSHLLVELDDSNLTYPSAAAEALVRGQEWHLAEADCRGALEELARADALLGRVRAVNVSRAVELGYLHLPAEAAALCALLGEAGEAVRHAANTQERLAAGATVDGVSRLTLARERAEAAQCLALSAYLLDGGVDQTRLFDEARALTEGRGRRAEDGGLRAEAIAASLRRGLESAAALQQGRRVFSAGDFPSPQELPRAAGWLYTWGRRAVFDAAIEAQLGSRDLRGARRVATELLAEEERQATAEPESWAQQQELAAAVLRLARVEVAANGAGSAEARPLIQRTAEILRPGGTARNGELTVLDRRIERELERHRADLR